jgi:hypothetical protein
MGPWPTQGDEKRLLEAQSLPLVIPTGAQRSGGTCGLAVFSWKCFSTERSGVERSAVSLPSDLLSRAVTTLPFAISIKSPDWTGGISHNKYHQLK